MPTGPHATRALRDGAGRGVTTAPGEPDLHRALDTPAEPGGLALPAGDVDGDVSDRRAETDDRSDADDVDDADDTDDEFARAFAAAGHLGRQPRAACAQAEPEPEPELEPDDDDEPLALAAAKPAIDPYVREVMRGHVAKALFGTEPPPVTVGRYQLRRELGTGGGGSVYVAWDPELTREVALKLVIASEPRLRARAITEGQALAKLSHPNVVPVFDVGVIDDRVYLVMELIRGQSLRAFAATRRPREVLAAYRQSGEGLAAAHAAKLVHRDFKPDNAMVGADGRVRVVDFGLAIEPGAERGGGGTPRYMAPEQKRGERVSAATDQYAFAVSLREALGTAPPWLERVLARAGAEREQDRFASMLELCAALARDPRTVWSRRAMVAVPLALAATGYFVGQTRSAAQRCEGGRAALGEAWSAARRLQAVDHLRGLGTRYAEVVAPQLASSLDAYAARWLTAHRDGCLAHQRGELSSQLYDRRQACLSGARTRLATLTQLAAAATSDKLAELMRVVPELTDPARCEDVNALAGVDPPSQAQAAQVGALQERLERAHVELLARDPAVEGPLGELAAQARAVGYAPLLAQAALLRGTQLVQSGRYQAAVAPLSEAVELGLRSRAYPTATEAFARRAWILGKLDRDARDNFAGVAEIAALASGLPAEGRFAEALLHNNLGSLHITHDQPTLAVAELERAIELSRSVAGPGAVELSNALANLALVTDDDARRSALFERWATTLRGKLGEAHPDTLGAYVMAAIESGEGPHALSQLRLRCPQLAALHPSQEPQIVDCMSELGWLEVMYGDASDAGRAFQRAAAGRGQSSRVVIARAYLAAATGRRAEARELLAPLLAELASPDAPWFKLLATGSAQLVLALAAKRAGDPVELARARDQAIAALSRAAAVQRSRSVLRRLAWARQLAAPAPSATAPR